ncbi:4-hydroxybenzoate octaprenyltransferase [Hydrogenovibrio sp. JE_KL2]|uniref:4-hydroxybenzoate octaprenyltransferase n=1 Tax=Hydrogenovibrio sp. JE_KL2 TaxID=2651188 RepID=UPI00128D0236|nr:4-hydroxybenzoate octaprenyltransferase [Hydrogenovibrio sp. JE_KL2]MBD3822013.1 4-hydroxybenzoate octaprenyltransferase [Thiotrichales bacterium]MPQ76456.1 4-hydroxybenzoate octaprenyltransferase [Hydrogenovibrio sp. JE_KL2]
MHLLSKKTWLIFIQLTRLDRPIGTYLVLWPALWALVLAADHLPSMSLVIIFTLGAFAMRSAGCIINDYADRHFDGHVERTCNRPLAAGLITEKQALGFFIALCLLSLGLVLLLNKLTIILSIGALILATLYPFMKRHTYWPQAFLGAAFAWAIPMAFAAVQNDVPWQSWIVFLTIMIWALIYDTAYAIGDKEDDLKIGIRSTAILFGEHVRFWIGFFQLIMFGLLIWIGALFDLAVGYHAALLIVFGLFMYHQRLLAKNDPKAAFDAFLNNHWVGLVLLLGTLFDKW